MRPNIVWFNRVTSTQTVARRFINLRNEIVIVANIQTRGRGRFGRHWESTQGGLWFSLLLFPGQLVNPIHYITMIGSLAVIKLLEGCDVLGAGIIWPNDIFVRGRKIAGILAEVYRNGVICGIGLNVNQQQFSPVIGPATSIRLEVARTFEIPFLLKRVLNNFYSYYHRYLQGDIYRLIQEYRKYLMLTNEVVKIDLGDKVITGILSDIDEEGRLILRETSGVVRRLSSGQVQRMLWS